VFLETDFVLESVVQIGFGENFSNDTAQRGLARTLVTAGKQRDVW